jgi:hypothetical protein
MIARYPATLLPAPRITGQVWRLAAGVALTIVGFGIGVAAIDHVNWLDQSATVRVNGSFDTKEAANYNLQSKAKFGVQHADRK